MRRGSGHEQSSHRPTQPAAPTLYRWLTQATEQKLVRREGKGTKFDPFRFRLPTEDDAYYDRGELPPLRPIGECMKRRGR